jgi:hypothetical protein
MRHRAGYAIAVVTGFLAMAGVTAQAFVADSGTTETVTVPTARLAPPGAAASTRLGQVEITVTAAGTGPAPTSYTVQRGQATLCRLVRPGPCVVPAGGEPGGTFAVNAHLGRWTATATVTASDGEKAGARPGSRPGASPRSSLGASGTLGAGDPRYLTLANAGVPGQLDPGDTILLDLGAATPSWQSCPAGAASSADRPVTLTVTQNPDGATLLAIACTGLPDLVLGTVQTNTVQTSAVKAGSVPQGSVPPTVQSGTPISAVFAGAVTSGAAGTSMTVTVLERTDNGGAQLAAQMQPGYPSIVAAADPNRPDGPSLSFTEATPSTF